MELSKHLDLIRIDELKIVQNVRLIHCLDSSPITSRENLRVQFEITGEVKGAITCYLLLDGVELSPMEKNVIYPLFTEAMNILVGRQISRDPNLVQSNLELAPPKINLNPVVIEGKAKKQSQRYELELEGLVYQVFNEYSLVAMN